MKKKPDLNEVFEALDKAGMADVDLLADRDRSLPQERPELFDESESEPMTDEDREWMKREDWEPDYDDEPRFGSLDAQQQEAADRALREKKKP